MKRVDILLDEQHPVFQWVNMQADKIGARGHVGTHLDCYTSVPEAAVYSLSLLVIDCRKEMPTPDSLHNLLQTPVEAVAFHTGNMETHGYGTSGYLSAETFLSQESLEYILEQKPLFLLIDSHGIGAPGKEHIGFDKLCESKGCHVIENVDFSHLTGEESEVKIVVDLQHPSSGKPCEVYVK